MFACIYAAVGAHTYYTTTHYTHKVLLFKIV